METFSAILVELQDFLFTENEEMPLTLRVHQEINQEAKELLLDMQTYAHLIGFMNIDIVGATALESRLASEGLKFDRLIITTPEVYNDTKVNIIPFLRKRYMISCYIDETKESAWKQCQSIHRLKF